MNLIRFSVITRRAPSCLSRLEEFAAPGKIEQGTTTREVRYKLLAALGDACRIAASGPIKLDVDGDTDNK
jgi:hypothetical protein